MAEVVRIMDVRAAKEKSRSALSARLRLADAQTPARLAWGCGLYFCAGAGIAVIFAMWMGSIAATSCFMAAGYCDSRRPRS